MLTTNLQESLDKRWKNCWPLSELRPLAIFDLLSYLYFIKKLDDAELIYEKLKKSAKGDLIFPTDIQNFTWSMLQNKNPKEIHQLFTKKQGVNEMMNHFAKTNEEFSVFFKAPLLIDPTPKLIFNVIQIINIIESSSISAKKSIIEYLFSKLNTSSQQEAAFNSEAVFNLILSLADPVAGDTIYDPAAGNGNLLLQINNYLKQSNNFQYSDIKLSGVEPDAVHLRIAAMNVMVHCISEQNIKLYANPEAINDKISLLVSSMNNLSETESAAENGSVNRAENEAYLLNDAVEKLKNNGRAVVLASRDFLKIEIPAIIKMRKKITDQNNLEAVITIDKNSSNLLPASAILIFNKSTGPTEEIWFYKWTDTKNKNQQQTSPVESNAYEVNEVANIIEKWKSRKDFRHISQPDSFFISADQVRRNNYILSFDDYKLVRQESINQNGVRPNNPDEHERVIVAKKENLHEFFETSTPLNFKKKKRKLTPVLGIVFIIFCAAFMFYWVYSKNKISTNISHTTPAIDSLKNYDENSHFSSSSNKEISLNNTSHEIKPGSGIDSNKYYVVSKAWFHFEPDSAKVKPLYLTPRKGLVVTAQKEEKGFVYVVYINNKGEATHGWLNKNDLQAVD